MISAFKFLQICSLWYLLSNFDKERDQKEIKKMISAFTFLTRKRSKRDQENDICFHFLTRRRSKSGQKNDQK
jgi:hypothetical protein